MNPIRGTVRQQKSRLRYVFFPINKVYILLLVPLQCWDSHSSCQHGAMTVVPIGETDPTSSRNSLGCHKEVNTGHGNANTVSFSKDHSLWITLKNVVPAIKYEIF